MVEHVVVEQIVVLGDQEKVQLDQVQEARNQTDGVDAGAHPRDGAAGAELVQRAPAAGGQFLHQRRHPLLGVMEQQVEVVDHQQVDRSQAEPLQAVLVGTHDAVVAVIEVQRERQRIAPVLLVQKIGPSGGAQHAAHLGGDHELLARAAAQEFAEAMLALAMAVERRGVEVADAGFPGALDHLPGGGAADIAEQVADRRTAEPKPGEFDAGAPQCCRLHALPNHGGRARVHRRAAPVALPVLISPLAVNYIVSNHAVRVGPTVRHGGAAASATGRRSTE